MYCCRDCKAVFDYPAEQRYHSEDYGDSAEFFCPECGGDSYFEAEECPSCGKPMVKGDTVCMECHLFARRQLARFAKKVLDYYNGEILEEMNEILNTFSLMELAEEL